MRIHRLFFAAITLALANPVQALELFWPSDSAINPCGTSLQNCINSTVPGRGDVVTIVDDVRDVGGADGLTFISENILINRDMTLRASPDVQAIFTGNSSILMTLLPNETAAVRDLSLTGGRVRLDHVGPNQGFATYIVERVRIRAFAGVASTPGALDCAIYAFSEEQSPAGPTGTFGRFIIRMNQINLVQSSQATTGICVLGNRLAGSAAKSEVSMNHVTTTATSQTTGILNQFDNGAVEVRRNRLVGTGIAIIDNDFSTFITNTFHESVISHNVAERFNTAILSFARGGTTTIAHNTLVCSGLGTGTGINTTSIVASENVMYRIINNVVSRCATGIVARPVNSTNSNNLVFDATTPFMGVSAGPGSILADPQFESNTYYRPLPTSPAINAGIADTAVAGFDVEGNRQPIVAPEIGAYEQVKDVGIQERFSGGAISEPLARSNPFLLSSDHPIATPLGSAPFGGPAFSSAQLEQPHALWLNGGNWLLRLATAPLAANRQFNIMTARDNHLHFLHSATSNSDISELDHPSVNNQPGAVVIVNERFDRVGTTAMDGNPLSVYYTPGTGRWFITNENSAPMTIGSRFNVMVSTMESGMSFTTSMPNFGTGIALRHPALDDNPCAVFSVGRQGLIFNPRPFVINYVPGSEGGQRPGRWRIEQPAGFTFPTGAIFTVIVDGTGSNRCPNTFFSNGFE
jgi:hypothetical protein